MNESLKGVQHESAQFGEVQHDEGGNSAPDSARSPAPAYGVEDVLTDQPGEPVSRRSPVRRARRSPWNRKRDKVLAAAIVVTFLTAGSLVWATSDTRATIDELAVPGPPVPPAPDAVPGSLTEIWRHHSSATPVPVIESSTVITAEGGEVAGRDPQTGRVRWRYARDLRLCTVASAWTKVNAVYQKTGFNDEGGCSEVTQLDPATGRRTAQRNGDAELGTRLLSDGSHVTATGRKLLNTWREDLVKSMEYGQVPAPLKPAAQPRVGCTYGSVATAAGKVGVIERCLGDPADRFTVYKTAGGEADEPKPVFSALLAGRSAKLVAMDGDLSAVALPEQKLLVVYGEDGSQRSVYPLDLPAVDLARDPPDGVVQATKTPTGIYWFTGSKTMALSLENLAPRWTLASTLGPGISFANRLVVPTEGGLAVLNADSGATVRTLGIDRRGYSGPVQLGSIGPILFEQQGNTLVALQ